MTAADAGSKPVTKTQVKKIAAKQARKAIKKAAPTLHVASADTVANQRVTPFGAVLVPNASGVDVGTVSGLTLTVACPSGVPSLKVDAPDGRYRTARFNSSVLSCAGDGDLSGPGGQEVLLGGTGSGTVDYLSSAGKAVSASYSWRSEGAGCQVFGTLVG